MTPDLTRLFMPKPSPTIARLTAEDRRHDALVAELKINHDDNFQLIHRYGPGEMIFNRSFRGGPRSDDWIVFTITDSLDRDERAKRKFYKTLVHLLEERARIRPSDVFVIMTVTPPANFSYAGSHSADAE